MSHPITTVTCTPPLPFLELTGLLSVSDGGRSVEMSLTLRSLCSSAEEQRSASISSYRSCWLGPHRQSNALRSRAGGPGEGGAAAVTHAAPDFICPLTSPSWSGSPTQGAGRRREVEVEEVG